MRVRTYVVTATVSSMGARLARGSKWSGDVNPAQCPIPSVGRVVSWSLSVAPSSTADVYIAGGDDAAGSFSTTNAALLESAGRAIVVEHGEGISSTTAAPLAAQTLDFCAAPKGGASCKIRIVVDIVDGNQ